MNGTKIADERKKIGLSQEDLAKKVGVSQKSISKYECGDRRPTYETLTAMAKLFGVSIDYLLAEDSFPSNEPRYTSDDEYDLILLYRDFQEKELTEDMFYSLAEFFPSIVISVSTQEKKCIQVFKKLNEDNQDIIIGKMKELLKEQLYESSVAAEESFIKKTGTDSLGK